MASEASWSLASDTPGAKLSRQVLEQGQGHALQCARDAAEIWVRTSMQ